MMWSVPRYTSRFWTVAITFLLCYGLWPYLLIFFFEALQMLHFSRIMHDSLLLVFFRAFFIEKIFYFWPSLHIPFSGFFTSRKRMVNGWWATDSSLLINCVLLKLHGLMYLHMPFNRCEQINNCYCYWNWLFQVLISQDDSNFLNKLIVISTIIYLANKYHFFLHFFMI